MCFPHIMNICVKHTIDAFSNSQLADETLARLLVRFFPGVVQRAEYIDAVKNNPLDSGRDTVRSIRASGLRRDEFMDTIKTGNVKGWFRSAVGPTGVVIKVPEHELLCDVPTRWDSTYYMINRIRAMRPVSSRIYIIWIVIHPPSKAIDHFLSLPTQKEIAKHKMSDAQWAVLSDYEKVLSVCNSTPCLHVKSTKFSICADSTYGSATNVRREFASPWRCSSVL